VTAGAHEPLDSPQVGAGGVRAAEKRMPGRPLLTQAETINWIAFATSDDHSLMCWEVIKKERRLEALSAVDLEHQARVLLRALQAKADGRPIYVPPPPPEALPDFLADHYARMPPGWADYDSAWTG
jgi:hypothetical protein